MLKTVTISIEPALIERIDIDAQGRGISRSRYIVDALEQHFEPVRGEVALMLRDLEHTKQVLSIREAEILDLKNNEGFLRAEFQKCNERLNRFLLPEVTETRRGFWSRVFRRESRESKKEQ